MRVCVPCGVEAQDYIFTAYPKKLNGPSRTKVAGTAERQRFDLEAIELGPLKT
jgi:hypothetical protein